MGPASVKAIFSHSKFPLFFNIGLFLIGCVLVVPASIVLLNEPFWGYHPLSFFLGCWMILSAIISFFSKKKNTSYFLLSSLSGVLLFLGFPDPSITPLLFVGFIPLLYIVEKVLEQEKRIRIAFRYAYSAFLVWNILSTFWVANTSFLPSVVAFTLNSLFMTIPFMCYVHFRKRFKLNISLIAFIAFWLAWEMIHLRWEISWPWLTLGNAFSSRSLWIQWYEYTGHLGGSVWILAMNALIFKVIQNVRTGGKISPSNLFYPVFLLMTPIFISFFIFFGYQEKGETIHTTIVQPNYEPHYQKFKVSQRSQLNQFKELVFETATDSTDYIVFPETSFGLINLDEFASDGRINALYNMLDSFPQAHLITGLSTYRLYEEEPEDVPNVRDVSNASESRFIQVQNSAVELVNRSTPYGLHVKGKLVPGAEIFPYSKLLFFFEPIVKKAGGSVAGHARSKVPTVLEKGKAKIAPSICYESIYGYWMRKYVTQGANLIFVITNDGWWDNTPGHRQHLAYSILRAIELRRSIARSANTGISCVINQYGQVFQPQAYNTKAAFNASLKANNELTFYAKYGDILGRISWLLSFVFISFIIRKSVVEKREQTSSKTSE